MTFSAKWIQEEIFRRVVTRYRGKQQGGLIFFDSVTPFSSIFSTTVKLEMTRDGDEMLMYLENRRDLDYRWTCTLWVQGYGSPRRNEPVIEITGNGEQMVEDIVTAMLLFE